MFDKNKLYIENRRYLGNKNKLIPFINEVIYEECGNFNTFADIFAGTGIVAHSLNKADNKIIINDILYSNYLAYVTWLGNEAYDRKKIEGLIREFNHIKCERDNYVSQNFGGNYFSVEDAKKIGTIREEIDNISSRINFREKAILITSLLYGMDRTANTCGHYDTFRRSKSINPPLSLKVPAINDERNKNNDIFNMDANLLVKNIKSDIVYVDTPYNSRQYSDTYHLLENISKWDKPKVEGVARKAVNKFMGRSKYCTAEAPKAFRELIKDIQARYIIVSYNNMGKKGHSRSNAKISDEEILEILNEKGQVSIKEKNFKYYTSGKRRIENHKERLFIVKCK
ncbi:MULTISPECIES: DNA adenine methylase [Tissierellales]|jgi:adenine-specific DNA-methyltransferase|uniref:Site-specific DNA-methyltransferase (adenine-specific) n=1 Tax=Acidilutibacter cellobiosedens TaxID=2507161 RepID=A0A410QGB3_9FIRM|nr:MULTISPECIES: DNA adenine methylase [Tissierellales]QAT63041.1 hypothetical protein EQM13_16445 [Acidilutibacter cellobiosedens]SCL85667.1 Modification methylase FokI [Sporanaerobacter sp. PP17-6a]